jgi:O-antigen/teichoic acid export membrane protein
MSTGPGTDAPAHRIESAAPARRVSRDALTTFVFRAGGMPFSFVISVITSRYLLPTGRGAFVLALLTVTLASTILGNVGVAATHELSRKDHERNAVVAQALLMATLLGVVGTLALFPIDYTLADRGFRNVAFVAFGLTPLLVAQTLSSTLFALGRLVVANMLQFLLPVITVAAMVVFVVVAGRGTTGAVFAWVVAQTVVAGVAVVATRDVWWPLGLHLPWERVQSMLLLGLRLGLVNLISLLNYRIELIILETSHGLQPVGLYSLASSLAELLWVVSTALATATIVPVVTAENDEQAADVVVRAIRVALVGTAVLGCMLAVLGSQLISPVFGVYFEPSVHPLLVLIVGVVAFAPGSIIAVYFSMRKGRTRYPLLISVISLGVTTVAALVLIPSHFVTGAAEACTLGYVTGMTIGGYWFARSTGTRLKEFLPRFSDYRSLRFLLRLSPR